MRCFDYSCELLILRSRRESLVHSSREDSHGRSAGAIRCSPLSEDKTRSIVLAATLNDGQLNAALNNALADGIASKASDLVDVELGHETLAMLLNSLHTDAKFRRDLFVGMTFGNELENFHFARSQAVSARVDPPASIQQLSLSFGNALRDDLAENRMPLVDFPNHFAQMVGGSLFRQKSNCA